MEATAPALATEQPVETAETIQTEAPDTGDADLAAIFDKNEAPEEPVSEAVEAEKPVEEPAKEAEKPISEDVDVPSDLPRALKDNWKTIPEDARRAFLDSQREMSRKMGDQGRLMQGLKPIQDTLSEAVQQFPSLANMKPEEVAKRTFALAELDNNMRSNPDQGAEQLVAQYPELAQAVAARVSGSPQSHNALAQANQQIEQMKRQLDQIANPEYLRSTFSQLNEETSIESQVNKFAEKAEHWGEVENTIPAAIAYVREAQPNASAEDVLQAAYDLEIRRLGKAPTAAVEAAPDPEKTEKALKAKSVNVRSQSTGKPREKTEDELMDAVWRKHNS